MKVKSSGEEPKGYDFAIEEVPASHRKPMVYSLAVWAGLNLVPVAVLTAMLLANSLTFGEFVLVAVIASLSLGLAVGIAGYVGYKTGLSFGLFSRYVFGSVGFIIPTWLIPLALVGWNAFNLSILALVTQVAFGLPGWTFAILVIVFMALFSVSAYYGFLAMAKLSFIYVPIMLLLLFVGVLLSLGKTGGIGGLTAIWPAVPAMSVAAGITSIFGIFGLGSGSMSMDIQRWCKNGKDAFLSGFISFIVIFTFQIVSGGIIGVATKSTDVGVAFAALGIGAVAWLVMFLLTWSTSDNDYYSASLGIANFFKTKRRDLCVFGVAIAAAIVAIAGIVNYLVPWLTIMAAIGTPIAGIELADAYYNKLKYPPIKHVLYPKPGKRVVAPVQVSAYISWIVGSAVMLYTNSIGFGVPPLFGIIIAFVLHLILRRVIKQDIVWPEKA